MKTIIFSIFTAFAINTCNNAQTDNANNDVNDADSVMEVAKSDNSVDDSFTSPDLAFFELHGNVHKLYGAYSVYEFDKKGNLIKVDSKSPFDEAKREYDEVTEEFKDVEGYKRGAKGYISEISTIESSTEYTWKDGKVAGYKGEGEGTGYSCTYTYNADGEKVKAVEKYYDIMDDNGEAEAEENITNYKITKRDGHGNWIERMENGYTNKRQILYFGESESDMKGIAGLNPENATLNFKGSIGGEKNATLELKSGKGEYTLSYGTRTVEFYSYNPASGSLVLKAFTKSTKQYIGHFKGFVTEDNGKFAYKGYFINESGSSVEVEMSITK